MKALSIKDIALKANVSITTVSFIINGKAKEKSISDAVIKTSLSDWFKSIDAVLCAELDVVNNNPVVYDRYALRTAGLIRLFRNVSESPFFIFLTITFQPGYNDRSKASYQQGLK